MFIHKVNDGNDSFQLWCIGAQNQLAWWWRKNINVSNESLLMTAKGTMGQSCSNWWFSPKLGKPNSTCIIWYDISSSCQSKGLPLFIIGPFFKHKLFNPHSSDLRCTPSHPNCARQGDDDVHLLSCLPYIHQPKVTGSSKNTFSNDPGSASYTDLYTLHWCLLACL